MKGCGPRGPGGPGVLGTTYKGMSCRVSAALQLNGPAGLGASAPQPATSGTTYKGMSFKVCAAPQLCGTAGLGASAPQLCGFRDYVQRYVI